MHSVKEINGFLVAGMESWFTMHVSDICSILLAMSLSQTLVKNQQDKCLLSICVTEKLFQNQVIIHAKLSLNGSLAQIKLFQAMWLGGASCHGDKHD